MRPRKTVTITRTNIVGRYATVRVRGALIAGEPADDAAILLEHFSFGWQPIESLDFPRPARRSRHPCGK